MYDIQVVGDVDSALSLRISSVPRILVSYRRADTDVIAGRIRDRLANHFGDGAVFMDIDNIPFGTDFRQHIKQALAESDVLIAVVGPRWVGAVRRGHARIQDEDDPVRVEIELALQRGMPIIPILIGSAKMPAADQLPESLKAFAFINAAPVDTGRDFHQHMDRLIRAVGQAIGTGASKTVQVEPSTRPGIAVESGVTQPPRGAGSPAAAATEALSTAAPNASDPLPLPDRPSLAVLPFQNMSGDPEQEYFADGMVEDIITALSRFKSLFVIARNSSFSYKGKSPDIRQVGRELGVRYVLEGSVRKAGTRLRISGQLIDASTGAHLWADRFDGALEDVFELQDQVTEKS